MVDLDSPASARSCSTRRTPPSPSRVALNPLGQQDGLTARLLCDEKGSAYLVQRARTREAELKERLRNACQRCGKAGRGFSCDVCGLMVCYARLEGDLSLPCLAEATYDYFDLHHDVLPFVCAAASCRERLYGILEIVQSAVDYPDPRESVWYSGEAARGSARSLKDVSHFRIAIAIIESPYEPLSALPSSSGWFAGVMNETIYASNIEEWHYRILVNGPQNTVPNPEELPPRISVNVLGDSEREPAARRLLEAALGRMEESEGSSSGRRRCFGARLAEQSTGGISTHPEVDELRERLEKEEEPMSHLIIVGSAHTRPFNRATGRTHEEQGAFCLHHYSGDATFPEYLQHTIGPFAEELIPGPQRADSRFKIVSKGLVSQIANTGVSWYMAVEGVLHRSKVVSLFVGLCCGSPLDRGYAAMRRDLDSVIVWRIGIQTFLFIGRPEVSISSPLGRLLHSIVSQVWGRQEDMRLVVWDFFRLHAAELETVWLFRRAIPPSGTPLERYNISATLSAPILAPSGDLSFHYLTAPRLQASRHRVASTEIFTAMGIYCPDRDTEVHRGLERRTCGLGVKVDLGVTDRKGRKRGRGGKGVPHARKRQEGEDGGRVDQGLGDGGGELEEGGVGEDRVPELEGAWGGGWGQGWHLRVKCACGGERVVPFAGEGELTGMRRGEAWKEGAKEVEPERYGYRFKYRIGQLPMRGVGPNVEACDNLFMVAVEWGARFIVG